MLLANLETTAKPLEPEAANLAVRTAVGHTAAMIARPAVLERSTHLNRI